MGGSPDSEDITLSWCVAGEEIEALEDCLSGQSYMIA